MARKPGKTVQALLEAVKEGDMDAQYRMGERYRLGKGVLPDMAKALAMYRLAAEQDHTAAQNDLGSMLLNGIGCDPDAAGAVTWFQRAADQGNSMAKYNLGKRFLHGTGVITDLAEAHRLISDAAAEGVVVAIGELGTMTRFGVGTPRDIEAAARLHVSAGTQGDEVARGNLSDYLGELEAIARNRGGSAALSLAEVHCRGLVDSVDKVKAREWLALFEERTQPELRAEYVSALTYLQNACLDDPAPEEEYNPEYVYGSDGKPMIVGGRPMLQSVYDDVRPAFLEMIRKSLEEANSRGSEGDASKKTKPR